MDRGLHLVNWAVDTKPVKWGGLGVRNLGTRILVTLARWFGRFYKALISYGLAP